MQQLETHRTRAHSFFLAILWLHVPLNLAVAWALGNNLALVGVASALLAVVASLVCRLGPPPMARITNAAALIGDVSILLAATAGHPWQVDVHMYYFAAVALIALYCDPAAIIVAAAVVAAHHLSLNFLLPNLVYPGGSDFGRVVLHAVILVVESAGLVWLAVMLTRAFEREHGSIGVAEEARMAAEGVAAQLQTSRDQERSRASELRGFEEQVAAERKRIVETLANKLSRIANGDLTARFDEDVEGQFEAVKRDFNEAASRLEAALRAVSDRALSLQSGTGEIARLSGELAQRNESQAMSLDRTTSALEQITTTLARSSEGADHARQVVAAADRQAKSGSDVVQKAIAAMDAITKSSSRIGQIIGAIDEIAFQTNLLALNAGVEAARAGDSGRGFAVVASEVRALAQRSAQAAKEIKELVNESIATVGEGAKLVADTGVSLKRITETVTEINGIVNTIAVGAKEQSSGLAEINVAVRQIDEMTQQNAAMAEEATAATHTLADESELLASLVRQFQVGGNSRGREEALRRELREAAPHAFRAPAPEPKPAPRTASAPKPVAKAPSVPTSKPNVSPRAAPAPVARPAAPPKRAVASGDDWTEF